VGTVAAPADPTWVEPLRLSVGLRLRRRPRPRRGRRRQLALLPPRV